MRTFASPLLSLCLALVAGLVSAQSGSPEEVVERYLEAMSDQDGEAAESTYSRETRAMMRQRASTPQQMERVAETYAGCTPEPARRKAGFAAVRYAIEDRQCAPFFLVREDSGWKLDLTMMARAIRFNARNEWRFDPAAQHAYGFAFGDWRFDAAGYPQEER